VTSGRNRGPNGTLPPIPVIFLTSVEEGESRGREVGAVGYLMKPVLADKLLELVRQHAPVDPLA
jgi:CheY-like chemotaxis protein